MFQTYNTQFFLLLHQNYLADNNKQHQKMQLFCNDKTTLVAYNHHYCRKRSIPTHSERLNPPTIIAKMALKSA